MASFQHFQVIARYACSALICAALLFSGPGDIHADSLAERLFHDAHEESIRGNSKAALKLYADGLALDPRNAGARIALAHLLRNDGQRDNAILVLKDGLQLDDMNAELHVRLGELLEAADDEKGARKHYDRAAEISPYSDAGIDANANLVDLDTRTAGTRASSQAEISWSAGPKPAPPMAPVEKRGNFSRLKSNLDGEWCLTRTQRHERKDGACAAISQLGDIAAGSIRAYFDVDDEAETLTWRGLEKIDATQWPEGSIRRVELSFGDRSVIQTAIYPDAHYIEFHFTDSGQCMQVSSGQHGEEHHQCPALYTFCRCN